MHTYSFVRWVAEPAVEHEPRHFTHLPDDNTAA